MKSANRRDFLMTLGGISIAGRLSSRDAELIEYSRTTHSIDVIRTHQGTRFTIQSVQSERPAFLAANASRTRLFVVNEIDEFEGLPCGTLESYAILPPNGMLALLGRRSLSLSATMPRHFAMSPDGRYLVVAAYGGGIYNVLPISETGKIGAPTQIIKEVGSGSHPVFQASAHPHSITFNPDGRYLIGTDLGSDRINVFRFRNGRMSRVQQVETRAGSGPAELSMNELGTHVTVRHALDSGSSHYRFDAIEGRLYELAESNR